MNLTQLQSDYKIKETDRASYPKSRFPDRPSVIESFGAITGDSDMSKLIPLTQGKFTIVDDEDFGWLNQWKWRAFKGLCTFYAIRTEPRTHRQSHRRRILMHRQILKCPFGKVVDHQDHNGLNNQRDNIRIATHSENQRNTKPRRTYCGHLVSSKYKGVYWSKKTQNWQVKITINRHQIRLGHFPSETEAALAYDTAARRYFKEFAYTNY